MKLDHWQLGPLTAMLTVGVLAAASGGAPSAAGAAGSSGDRIVLVSNRDGHSRGYTAASDGSRLTPLLGQKTWLVPAALSAGGRTIAYVDGGDRPLGIYVSRANGSGLRRVVRGAASTPALSRDGRLLAFTRTRPGIWIAGTDGRAVRRLTRRRDGSPDWSPDGNAVVFFRAIGVTSAVVVQPLRGPQRVVGWSLSGGARWSPDGRWIAYENEGELWLVRPGGAQRHRVARGIGAFDWAPGGGRLAFTARGEVVIVAVDGRRRRLHPRGLYVENLAWSPDGQRLALTSGYPSEIWSMGVDRRGLRRLTNEGSNGLLGWTRLAPVLPPARPLPRTEHVIGRNALTTRAPIFDIAADGARIAFASDTTHTDCRHVAVWTPALRSVRRLPDVPAPCGEVSSRDGLGWVTLAGTRAAWVETAGGNTLEDRVFTATLAHPKAVELAAEAFSDDDSGATVGGLAGDSTLLVFTVEVQCSLYREAPNACPPGPRESSVGAATLYRIGGRGPCPLTTQLPTRICTAVAKADGRLSVLAVDAGRIVVRTETGVRVLTSTGSILLDLAVKADAAALSGDRLALRTADAVDVYDVASGRPVARFAAPRGLTLDDLDRDILVTAFGGTVTLRRLGDGRTTTVEAGGRAQAQLEPPGLFVAGARRLTFMPMADVLRRLG